MMRTYIAKADDIKKECFLVDATDKILGRLAARVASILRGKHKPIFTPFLDTGDMVVIINAEKIKVTGKKLTDKEYQRYSGYPSGQKRVTLENMLKNRPTTVLKLAIQRMLPKGKLGDQMLKKLRVYVGEQHPHIAQKPAVLEV